jgi:hypothetical protein
LPALLRVEIERGKASIVWQRQHFGNQCGVLERSRGLRKQSAELVEPRPRGVVVRHSSGILHLVDDRKKCAIRELWGSEMAQPRVRFGRAARFGVSLTMLRSCASPDPVIETGRNADARLQ